MDFERKKDRSIYYWLKDDVFSDASWITIIPDYEEDEATVPSVVVRPDEIDSQLAQMGDRRMYNIRVWYIDIYAVNKDQRSDIAYRIMRELDNGIPILDFDEGFPPAVTPSQIGAIIARQKRYTPINVNPELIEKMYWRGYITIVENLSQLN
jgi:hypothetical protein